MTTPHNGGPAFPVNSDNYANPDSAGMTLRDYFASNASDDDVSHQLMKLRHQYPGGVLPNGWRAIARYMHADDMLEAREST